MNLKDYIVKFLELTEPEGKVGGVYVSNPDFEPGYKEK